MRFSLKTMLLSLCALGASLGIMGKLLLESPETFLQVLTVSSTIVPFLLAIGTIIWLGLRAKPRWGLVSWGCVLLLFPIVVHLTLAFAWPTRNPLRVLTSQRLIQRRLPKQVNEPWVWNELKDRLSKGDLSGEEVDEAVEELISYMQKAKPNGWNQPIPWQCDFIRAAIQGKMITEEVFLELGNAFFGPNPIVKPLSIIPDGVDNFQLELEFGNPWSRDSGLGIELFWDVSRVLLDDAPVQIGQVNKFAEHWSGVCQSKLEPGEHQVTIEIECAYVDENLVNRANAAQLPIEQWPKARKRWKTSVTVPLKVEPTENQ